MRTALAVLALLGPGVLTVRAQEVTLPLEDYDALRRRANPVPLPAPSPPAPYAIESSQIEIEIGDESARVVEKLTLSLFDAGWQTVPLAGAAGLTSVELGALEGRVTADEERVLIVRGVGRHEVRLEYVVALVTHPASVRETRKLSLELSRAALVTGSIVTASDVEDVRLISGGLIRKTADGGRWELIGAPSEVLEIEFLGKSRALDRDGLPLKFQALSASVTTLRRTRWNVRGYVSAEVIQGRLETLRLPIPSGLDGVRVEADEAGWAMEGGSLVVTPASPVTKRFSATLVLTGKPEDSFDAPLIVPQGASSSVLVSTFKVDGDGIPILVDAGSARQAQPEDLNLFPEWVSSRTGRAFVVHDGERPPRWNVEWSDEDQQMVLAAQVDRLIVDAAVGVAGQAAYQCWAVVRTSGAPSLELEMPPGFELARAERDGRIVTPGIKGDGMEVPLVGGAVSQSIHLVGIVPLPLPGEGADLEVPLPALSVPVGRVEVRIVLPGGFSYTTRSAHVEAGVPTISDTQASSLFSVPAGFSLIEASWSAFTSRPAPMLIRMKERKHKKRWF